MKKAMLTILLSLVISLVNCGGSDKNGKMKNGGSKSVSSVSKKSEEKPSKSSQNSPSKDLFKYPSMGKGNIVLSGTLKKDTEIQKIQFKEGTLLYFHENGKIKQIGNSPVDITVNGIPFDAKNGNLAFYPNGQVSSGKVVNNTIFKEIPLKGGKNISFYKNGQIKICHPTKSITVNGINVILEEGELVRFYKTGVIVSFKTDKIVKVGGLSLYNKEINGLLLTTSLHENGKVQDGILAESSVINGIPCLGGKSKEHGDLYTYWISLYPNGDVKKCYPSKDFTLKSTKFDPERKITAIETGIITEFKKGDGKRIK